MAYQKTVWEPREGENLDKFLKYEETADSVVLINAPDVITRPGTPFSPGNMDHIEEGIEGAHILIAAEAQKRKAGDIKVLGDAKAYADGQIANAVAATQTWLPAVDTIALLPVITDTSKNWLCRVRDAQTVYQCVAGQTAWVAYSDKTDLVNELELAAAVGEHNESEISHEDIRAAIEDETNARTAADQQLQGQLEALAPEGMGNLPGLFAEIETKLGQKAPTNHASAANTYGIGDNTNYGHTKLNSSTLPPMNGVAAVGNSGKAADASHVHPTDTSRAPVANAVLTGQPRVHFTYPIGNNNDPCGGGSVITASVYSPLAVVPETTDPNDTNLPVGSYILVTYDSTDSNSNAVADRNFAVYITFKGGDTKSYTSSRAGTALSGTWLSCGASIAVSGNRYVLCRRVG